jgi:hypothetical protein
MSFILASENGFVCDIGSAVMMGKVTAEIERAYAAGPLYDFIQEGKTRNPKGCVHDIVSMITSVKNPSVVTTLNKIKDGLKTVKEIGIISQ